MRLNLSSQIVLNKVPVEFYKPKTTVEYSEISRMEKIRTDIFASMAEGASHVADGIAAGIKAAQHDGKFYVMALGTGSSLTAVYEELIRRYQEKTLSFRNVVVFNAYEYYPLQQESSLRTINQLKERFLSHVDVQEQNIFSLDGFVAQDAVQDCCRLYEQRIKTFGGLDVALIGIGRSGNIAANEPGSGIQSVTRLILIGNTSREEMEASEQTKETIPPCSLTMGIATLLSAKTVYLTAWGEEKAEIMQKVVENSITDTLPASFLQTHPDAHVVLDLSAAAHLTRIEHPWLVTSCQWTDKLVRSALVWLCQKIGKPILKLTNKDYNENGLSELLALYGSAYNANIKIFNDLQHTITGWPGGKPNADDTYRPERSKPYPKRVIVFSPHPDDDVISMGGTIRRLVQQKHDVHVAYETSGNIAVGDEEVTRFMHFINGFNQLFAESKDSIIANKYKEIKTFFANKKEGDFDTRDILTIKGLIRRGEARIAVGIVYQRERIVLVAGRQIAVAHILQCYLERERHVALGVAVGRGAALYQYFLQLQRLVYYYVGRFCREIIEIHIGTVDSHVCILLRRKVNPGPLRGGELRNRNVRHQCAPVEGVGIRALGGFVELHRAVFRCLLHVYARRAVELRRYEQVGR